MSQVTWIPVNGSHALRAIGLEQAEGSGPKPRLHVKFLRGRTYVYNIPNLSYWDGLCNAASKGRYYDYVIKARFDYVAKY